MYVCLSVCLSLCITATVCVFSCLSMSLCCILLCFCLTVANKHHRCDDHRQDSPWKDVASFLWKYIQGGPKSCTFFRHTISLELFKIKLNAFHQNVLTVYGKRLGCSFYVAVKYILSKLAHLILLYPKTVLPTVLPITFFAIAVLNIMQS